MSTVNAISAKLVQLAATEHPIRVGIDGFCASGKTTLADALAGELRAIGRDVLRVSADDFQNPPQLRWQLGPRSAEGYEQSEALAHPHRDAEGFAAQCRAR